MMVERAENIEIPVQHQAQLLALTPEVIGELASLEKYEVIDKDRLDVKMDTKFAEYESVATFDGEPIRFIKQGTKMYLWDSAEEVGGMIEYAYLTEIPSSGKEVDSADLIYLPSAIGARRVRRKKLVKKCDKICRGVAKTIDLSHVNLLIRKGQVGYRLAQVQASKLQTGAVSERMRKAQEKMDIAAEKIIYRDDEVIEKAQVYIREKRIGKHKVTRLKASSKVEKIYSATSEVEEDSALEIYHSPDTEVELEFDIEQVSEEIEIEEKETGKQSSVEVESDKNLFEEKKKTATIRNVQKTKSKGDNKENAKSDSKGTERDKG